MNRMFALVFLLIAFLLIPVRYLLVADETEQRPVVVKHPDKSRLFVSSPQHPDTRQTDGTSSSSGDVILWGPRAPKHFLSPRLAAEGYVAAVLEGRVDDAVALAAPGKRVACRETIAGFHEILDVMSVTIDTVYVSRKVNIAKALSAPVTLTEEQPDGQERGLLVITLNRIDGAWLVTDIDFESDKSAAEEIEALRQQYPDTLLAAVPSSEDPNDVIDAMSAYGTVEDTPPSRARDDTDYGGDADGSRAVIPSSRARDDTTSVSPPPNGTPAATASEVEKLRTEYHQSEQQSRRLAEKYRDMIVAGKRQAGVDPEGLKNVLIVMVHHTFGVRQELQRAELAEFRQRLAAIEKQIEDRERMQDEIVQHRVEELLNPNLEWRTADEVSSAAAVGDNSSEANGTEHRTGTVKVTPPPLGGSATTSRSETHDRRLTLKFRDQPWQDVLQWIASQYGLSLEMDDLPPGTFSYSDSQPKSLQEVIALLNDSLRPKGHVLVISNDSLRVVRADQAVKSSDEKNAFAAGVAQELARLQGTWRMKAYVTEGVATSEDDLGDGRCRIEGDVLSWRDASGTEIEEMNPFRLDPSKNPKQIDLLANPNDRESFELFGIYSLDLTGREPRLRICWGKERPARIMSGPTVDYWELERIEGPPLAMQAPKDTPGATDDAGGRTDPQEVASIASKERTVVKPGLQEFYRQIQGKWFLTSCEERGERFTVEQLKQDDIRKLFAIAVFDDRTFSSGSDPGDIAHRFDYRVDYESDPQRITLTDARAPNAFRTRAELENITLRGLIRVAQDQLTFAIAGHGGDFPDDSYHPGRGQTRL